MSLSHDIVDVELAPSKNSAGQWQAVSSPDLAVEVASSHSSLHHRTNLASGPSEVCNALADRGAITLALQAASVPNEEVQNQGKSPLSL